MGDNISGKKGVVKGSISGNRTEGSMAQKHSIVWVLRSAKCLTLLKFEVRNREYWKREEPSNHVDKRGIFPEGIVKGPRYQSDRVRVHNTAC